MHKPFHNQIDDYTKQLRTDVNLRPVLKSLYQQLDHYQFKKDYCCVVIDSKADYKKRIEIKLNKVQLRCNL